MTVVEKALLAQSYIYQPVRSLRPWDQLSAATSGLSTVIGAPLCQDVAEGYGYRYPEVNQP
ncbi:hypothetical protein GCM10009682_57670 [Luedemannella flava]|uniref:Uncharacterized protein n=1 Tax=Luedemannella flava TaxID=349316 RepID=A0ABP4YVK1_9ACTN